MHSSGLTLCTTTLLALVGNAPTFAQDLWNDGVIDLASLDGSNGFAVNGVDSGDLSGVVAASAGDVNGDGNDDLIIGAILADPNGLSRAGESYVVFGNESIGLGGAIELSSLDGSNGYVLNGIDAYDYSGNVSSAGDVNGDGVDDLLIGASSGDPQGTSRAGEFYVVFGGGSVGNTGVVELASLNGSNGFVLEGVDPDDAGSSVTLAGDLNGDGTDDLLIAAIGADPNGQSSAGESYVVFGNESIGFEGAIELSSLDGHNGYVIKGIDPYDRSGISLSSAGDVNGDGTADLIIGARGGGPGDNTYAGESYVVFGGDSVGSTGVIELSSLNGSNGYVLNGIDAFDGSGVSVSTAGDVNGDGFDDLVIGAYRADPNDLNSAGESYVVFGGPSVGISGMIELSSLDGANGFVLNGVDAIDTSGRSVSSVGDVNGDGIDDLIIGAIYASPNGTDFAGASYVVFGGHDVGGNGVFELSSLNGRNGFVLNGIENYDGAGQLVASAGDVNGDGIDDLLIGAGSASPNGKDNSGQTYVIFGIDTSAYLDADFNWDGTVDLVDLDILGANWETSGATNASGDANGDGVVDLLDLDLLGVQWQGASTSFDAALTTSGITVPEPASLVAMLAGVGLLTRKSLIV